MMEYSVVEYFGSDAGHSCGYCKQSDTSLSHGMWAHRLTCQDYQDLLDRGWRRSGKYCYKPIMEKTCCPQYTIRCDVPNIKLTKSQKKVIKRLNKFLIFGGKTAEGIDGNNGVAGTSTFKEDIEVLDAPTKMEDKLEHLVNMSGNVQNSKATQMEGVSTPVEVSSSKCSQKNTGLDPSKPKCRKAKEIRQERRLQKLARKTQETGTSNSSSSKNKRGNMEKSIDDLINDLPPQLAHKLEVKLVRCSPESSEFKTSFKAECLLFMKYQIGIHKETPEHSDEKQFRRFLVDGPLEPVNKCSDDDDDIPSTGLGAFHQQYYLDGKLIAVGVLDILPNIVSSKYFFYDPDYSFLSLGTYSAIREIYFTRSLHNECPSIRYYYMGFYIQSCPKMNYKGRYYPSYLLCPETYIWQPAENCFSKLVANKYSRLEDDESKTVQQVDIGSTLILHRRQAMHFVVYLAMLEESERKKQEEEVTEYSNIAGVAASSMLLYRN